METNSHPEDNRDKTPRTDKSLSASGVFLGLLSAVFFWLPLISAIIILVSDDSVDTGIILIGIFLTLVCAGITARKVSDFDKGYLEGTEGIVVGGIKYITYLFIVIFLGWYSLYRINILEIESSIVLGGTIDILSYIAFETGKLILLVGFSIFIIYAIWHLFSDKNIEKNENSIDNIKISSESNRGNTNDINNWLLNRIVAPLMIALILGSITYLVTGDFRTGGTVSLLSFPLNFMFTS